MLAHLKRVWGFTAQRGLPDCVWESYGPHSRVKPGNEGGHLHLYINLTSTQEPGPLFKRCAQECFCNKNSRSRNFKKNLWVVIFQKKYPSIFPRSSLSNLCTYLLPLLFMNKFWTASAWPHFYPPGIFGGVTDVSIICIFQSQFCFDRLLWERPYNLLGEGVTGTKNSRNLEFLTKKLMLTFYWSISNWVLNSISISIK